MITDDAKTTTKKPVANRAAENEPLLQPFDLRYLHAISGTGLRRLIEHASPSNYFLKVKDLLPGKIEEAATIIATGEPDAALMDALAAVSCFLEEDGRDVLERSGISVPAAPSHGEAIVGAYIESTVAFRVAALNRINSEKFAGRVYRFAMLAPGKTPPRGHLQLGSRDLKKEFSDYFESRQYSTVFRLVPYVNGDRVGFVVFRYTPFHNRAGLNANEKPFADKMRHHRTDVVFLNKSTGLCSVSCAEERDAHFYRGKLSTLLFGTGDAFSKLVQPDLQFALATDLRSKLLGAGGPGVRVVMTRREFDDLKEVGRKHKGTRKLCVSEKYPVDVSMAGAVVTAVYLSIEVTVEGGRTLRGTVRLRTNTVEMPQNIPEEAVFGALRSLGVLPSHES